MGNENSTPKEHVNEFPLFLCYCFYTKTSSNEFWLLTIMDQPYDKLDDVQAEIDRTKDTVAKSIQLAIDKGDKLSELDVKAQQMSNEAAIFNKQAKAGRRHFWLKQWKMLALILFVLAALIVIIWLIVDQTG
eukprot:341879_1